jgi:hypothetical protein
MYEKKVDNAHITKQRTNRKNVSDKWANVHVLYTSESYEEVVRIGRPSEQRRSRSLLWYLCSGFFKSETLEDVCGRRGRGSG